MPNGLRIEHFCDIIPNTQSWLVLNMPVFMFVYITFNVPPTRITDLVRNVSDEKNSHLCLCFCFCQLGLCSISYTANEYFIYHFCSLIKDFSISFSNMIIAQDFETVTFLCVTCMQADFLCYFLLNEKGARFKSVQ